MGEISLIQYRRMEALTIINLEGSSARKRDVSIGPPLVTTRGGYWLRSHSDGLAGRSGRFGLTRQSQPRGN